MVYKSPENADYRQCSNEIFHCQKKHYTEFQERINLSTSFFNSGFNYFFQVIFTFLETNKKKKMMSLIAAKSNVDQKILLGEEDPTGLNTN